MEEFFCSASHQPARSESVSQDTSTISSSSSLTRSTMWLHSVSLLVLLVVSWSGSQAASAPQHLCGSHLVDALYLVCGNTGFFFNPRRDVDSLLGFLPPKAGGAGAAGGNNEVADYAFKDQMEMMVKRRGIVELCCHQPCSIVDLQNYCN